MEDYGLALKKLREYFKLTQRELGDRVGISNHAISKWENGVNQPDISTLRAICAVYGISTEDFFRIAAGEDVESVIKTPQNTHTDNKTTGAGTGLTQNNTPTLTENPPTTARSGFPKQQKLIVVLSSILAAVIAVLVAFAIGFGFQKDSPTNAPTNSESHSGISNSSNGLEDTSSDSASGDSSSDFPVPPTLITGHLDYYVDGRYYGAHDIVRGEEVKAPKVEKSGYVFLGWYTAETGGESFDFKTFDFENMDTSYELYARFRPVRYYVVFSDEASGATHTFAVEYEGDWDFPSDIFSRGGYTLTGWQSEKGITYPLGAAGENLCLTEGGIVRFNAVWIWTNPDAVRVKFINPDGEVATADLAQYVGVPFNLPESTVTKTGHKFGGYIYANTYYQPGDSFVIREENVRDGEFVISWYWKAISYTIQYTINYQGKQYVDSQTYSYSEWDMFWPKNSFIGWIDFDRIIGWVIDGTTYKPETYIPDFLKVDGVTHHAEAVLDLSVHYTLKFESGDSTTTGTMKNVKGTSEAPAILPECSFALKGYMFTGWLYEGKTYSPGDSFVYIDGLTEYTLTALWAPAPHTLTIVSDKHPGQEFTISVTYLDKIPYADILASCEEHGWDLTGLTLWGLQAKQTTYVAGPNGSYACTHAVAAGDNVVVKLLWESIW